MKNILKNGGAIREFREPRWGQEILASPDSWDYRWTRLMKVYEAFRIRSCGSISDIRVRDSITTDYDIVAYLFNASLPRKSFLLLLFTGFARTERLLAAISTEER